MPRGNQSLTVLIRHGASRNTHAPMYPGCTRDSAELYPEPMAIKRKTTDRQDAALEAVIILTDRLGRAPSAAEVGKQIGVTKAAARRLMLENTQNGLMTAPTMVVQGEWKATAAGKRRVQKNLTQDA